MLIFVDRHDILGAFHTRQVLDSATDTTGNVERRFYGLTRLPDLVTVGQPAGIDNNTSSASCSTYCSRKFLDQVIVRGFAQASTTTHDTAGILQRCAFALNLDALENLHLQ